MIIYTLDQPGLIRWAGGIIGIKDFGPAFAMGIIGSGAIAAVAVFHNYRNPSIEVSMASVTPRWGTKEIFKALTSYPFIQLNCRRITATTEAKNQSVRTFLQRFGFTEEGYHPHVFPDGDAVTYGLLRENCKWLER